MQVSKWEFNKDEISDAAGRILALAGERTIFIFIGEMGAGKTTLIKAMCYHLGVEEHTSSPTFALVNTYQGFSKVIYHFDLFRLRDIQELQSIGFTEYLDSGRIVCIEWPELAMPLLEGCAYVQINLRMVSHDVREIEVIH